MISSLPLNFLRSHFAALGIIPPPAIGVRALLAEGRLVEILSDLPAEPMRATLLYAQRKHLPRRVAAVMNWLASVLSPYLEPDDGSGPHSLVARE